MKKILKQDSFILGIVFGIIAPLVLFTILYYINLFIGTFYNNVRFVQTPTLQLAAIIVNVLLMRQYLVKLKYDKTGRGFLLVTFVLILAYFINDYLIK